MHKYVCICLSNSFIFPCTEPHMYTIAYTKIYMRTFTHTPKRTHSYQMLSETHRCSETTYKFTRTLTRMPRPKHTHTHVVIHSHTHTRARPHSHIYMHGSPLPYCRLRSVNLFMEFISKCYGKKELEVTLVRGVLSEEVTLELRAQHRGENSQAKIQS